MTIFFVYGFKLKIIFFLRECSFRNKLYKRREYSITHQIIIFLGCISEKVVQIRRFVLLFFVLFIRFCFLFLHCFCSLFYNFFFFFDSGKFPNQGLRLVLECPCKSWTWSNSFCFFFFNFANPEILLQIYFTIILNFTRLFIFIFL